MATSNYNLDINKQAIIKPVVILRQGDYGIDTMRVSLSVANEPMDLTGATVKFMGTTAGGRQIIDDVHVKIIDAKGGVFEYVFPSQAAGDIGEYKVAYFLITQANGQSSTMDFRVQVLSGVDISAPVASEYISHYETMVTELNSAYDSATSAANEKVASTVSSLATSAATVLDSALTRVNDINSTANNASSAASNAISMASSVASAVTSQASYINSVASSATSNVSSVAAGVVDKLNNISVGGRNYILNSNRSLAGSGDLQDTSWVNTSIPVKGFSNTKMVVSVRVDYDNITSISGSKRLGISLTANQKKSDGTTVSKFFIAWRSPSVGESFHGRIYSTYDLSGIDLESIVTSQPNLFTNGLFIQGITGTNVSVSNPKIEIGNVPTDWTPAPEDVPSNDAQLVHKTGTETIAGDKTFTGNVTFSGTSSIVSATARGQIFDGYDLNGYTDSYKYVINGAKNLVNYPSGASTWATLDVEKINQNTSTQTLTDTNNKVFIRNMGGNPATWSSWVELAPASLTSTVSNKGVTMTFKRFGNIVTVIGSGSYTGGDVNTFSKISDGVVPSGYLPSGTVLVNANWGANIGQMGFDANGAWLHRGPSNLSNSWVVITGSWSV